MADTTSMDVSLRDPQIDDRLRFQGRVWEVTNRATYRNEEGYRVIEWTCENANIEAYLLKEFEDNKPPRWFFTRWMPDSSARTDGLSLEDWIDKHPGQTPSVIRFQGTDYTYASKTDGIYESDDLGQQKKLTWDCWDAAHKVNLAIEIWQNGNVDLYRGSYTEASDVILLKEPADHPIAQLQSLSKDPQNAMGVLVAGFFLLFVLASMAPFETILAWVLGLSFAGVAILALTQIPALTACAALLVAGGFYVFGSFAPLTTVPGLSAAVGLPLIFALYARQHGHTAEHRDLVLYLAGWTSAMPIMVHGFYIYFHYAPGPRTFGEMLMAILPAAIAGGLGVLMAFWIIPESDDQGHFSSGGSA
jgi:hypothetical protein